MKREIIIEVFLKWKRPGFLSRVRFLLVACIMLMSNFSTAIAKKTINSSVPGMVDNMQQVITGKATDEKGSPIDGVSVRAKGTSIVGSTDENGHYRISVPGNVSVLVFSSVGFTNQEVLIGGSNVIDVVLEATVDKLEEVVVVGYGVQKKTSMTAAVSTMKAADIANVPSSNLSNNLGGRLSGIIVKQPSGEPGRDGSSIFIRGISTIGSSQPLLVVDGVPRSFQQLDPNSIESFTVLKDAAAVAPYGIAGANGVILVTTKKGQTGEPTISYNGYVGFQNPTVLPEFVNSVQFATLRNDIARNQGLPLPYSDEALQKFADGSDPDAYSQDEVFDFIIGKNAPITYHNLEVTGGTDRIKYYGGLGFQFQQGMWSTTNNSRYNLALNLDARVTATTQVSINVNGRVSNGRYPSASGASNSTAIIMELANFAHPGYGPMVFSNGMYGRHVMAAIFDSGYMNDNSTAMFTQLNIEQQIPFLSGLKLRGTVAYDPTFSNTKNWTTPMHLASIDLSQEPYVITNGIYGQINPSLKHYAGQSQQFTYQAGFDYLKSFSEHNLSFLGLFEARANDSWGLEASRRNYNLFIDEINMGSSSSADMTTYGTSTRARQIGFVYRATYDYAGKYLLEASGRYDGHYYFAPESRFGFFPALSVGWRLSEEKFLKDKLSWLDHLKLRASYGEVGALAGEGFQYLSSYNVAGPGYKLAGYGVQVVNERNEPNFDITWERAKKTDFGVELILLNNMVHLEADYFYEKRSNMLVSPEVITPEEYGIGLSQVNQGIMENRGIDLSVALNYGINEDLFIRFNGTFTYAKNKLLQTFENMVTYNNPNRRRTGRPLGTQFGYNAIGFFKPDDFNTDGTLKPDIAVQPWGAVQPGDIRYEDANGDGRIDANDEMVIGDPNQSPRIVYGFSPNLTYKNWSLEVLFQGAAKTHLYHSGGLAWAFYNGGNALVENLDYWRLDNQDAKHPRITGAPTTNNTQVSSFWMRNAAYLRMKNVTLMYRVPDEILKRVGVQNVRVYLSSQNLITWSELNNWDPESSNLTYPQQQVVSFGVNFSL